MTELSFELKTFGSDTMKKSMDLTHLQKTHLEMRGHHGL
jgi:hypothetical protein